LKVAYQILLHVLGVGCVAACIGIADDGALDIHWSGWVAVGFFVVLALGIRWAGSRGGASRYWCSSRV